MVKYGLDVLCETNKYDALLQNKRIGLITTPAGVNSRLISSVDVLHERYGLAALFSPEHGIRGNIEAGELVDTYVDEETGIPVYSLYRKDSKRLTGEMLEAIDIMIYDIQDVGSRFYTFVYTMLYAMEDCAKAGIPFLILDRPNPLGGITLEGNILEEDYRSFVGDYPMCMRYGLTAGEVAMLANMQQNLDAALTVVPCEGWERSMQWPDTGLLWTAPSPALTTFEATLLYSGTCLFEGTNLSEGRGTAAPFRWIGAAYIKNPGKLADRFNSEEHRGICARPLFFTPQASKHAGSLCGGVELHLTDRLAARPVRAALSLLYAVKEEYPEDFAWCTPLPPATRPHIELLTGSAAVKSGCPLPELLAQFKEDEETFRRIKGNFHIYK